MSVAVIVVLGAFFVLFLIRRMGNPKFWKIVNLDPNEFYNFIKDNDAWRLSNEDTDIELNGPFRLYVPSLSKQIKIYGVIGMFEDSQAEYVQYFKKLKD